MSRIWEDFFKPIISWQRITQKPTFCITKAGFCVLDSMAFLCNFGKYKYWLLAVLNSDLMYLWTKNNVHEYGSTGFRLSNQYVEQMPIPLINNLQLDTIDTLVKQQLNSYNTEIEKQIQNFVYEIYNISNVEKEFIASKIG